ncbi:GIY-YIG nuclease family protein [Streptomyces lavendulocolor]|uniref:GIY-YIG nuclease family protein n=1 Tax=Streptomyces lavendulocolor TaxID=67316 RepID=UPI003C3050A8
MTTHQCAANQPALCPAAPFVTYPVPLCQAHAVDIALQVTDRLFATAIQPAYAATLFGGHQGVIDRATRAPDDVWTSTSHPPVVYFLTNGDRIKIGMSRNVRARVSALSLRRSNARLLLSGGRELEQALHHAFAQHRLGSSEWFVAHPDIEAFITAKAVDEPRESPAPTPAQVLIPIQKPPTADEKICRALKEHAAPGRVGSVYLHRTQIAMLTGLEGSTMDNAFSRLTQSRRIHRQSKAGKVLRGYYGYGPAPTDEPDPEPGE